MDLAEIGSLSSLSSCGVEYVLCADNKQIKRKENTFWVDQRKEFCNISTQK